MTIKKQARYTREFRAEAVKLAQQPGMSLARAAKQLQMSTSTLENWLRRHKAGEPASERRDVDPRDAEISRLKRDLHNARMDVETLKKAAAYFARRGTHS